MLNKQQPFGADVITRISATMLDPARWTGCSEAGPADPGRAGREVCSEAGVDPAEVYEVAAGRQRHHDRTWRSASTPSRWGSRRSSCPPAPTRRCSPPTSGSACTRGPARSSSPPSAPTSAATSSPGMLAPGMDRDKRIRLFIDVGTNCEIVLGNGDRLLATAAPAGPAFEGGAIRCGMRAADGAIEVVSDRRRTSCELQVIGDAEPAGLCGSGLVDAVAELVRGRAARPLRPVRRRRAGRRARPRPGRTGSTRIGDERVFVLHWLGEPDATPRTRSTCPSATSASSSSPRRRSPPAGSSCWRSSGLAAATSSRCCWPGRSAATCRPRTRSGSGWCPSCPCCGS